MHRTLVIGAGSIGARHARCFLATGRTEVGICEIDDALRAEVAERYGIERTYARLEDAAADGWEAAVIATPAPLHIPMAATLAEKGAALLIEKPLSVSLDAVEGKAPPLCTLKEGEQTLKVNLAALASADNCGAWQTV